MTALLQTEMAKIPPEICTYVGERVSSLTDDHASSPIARMDAIINQGQLEQDASANYHQFVRSIPYEIWSAPPWSEHLERLFPAPMKCMPMPPFSRSCFQALSIYSKQRRRNERLCLSSRCSKMQPVRRTPTLRFTNPSPGIGLRVRTHYSHQMTEAARAIAAMKFLMLRSKRVGYTAPVLEAAKHALDDVALPVDGLVIMVLDLAVLARWDDGRGSAFCQPVAQGFAVIALVGDEFGGGRHGFDTALGDLGIMDVSWCQEQDEGPAFRIADSVELGVAAPLGAADAMGQGPPFPPPAQR